MRSSIFSFNIFWCLLVGCFAQQSAVDPNAWLSTVQNRLAGCPDYSEEPGITTGYELESLLKLGNADSARSKKLVRVLLHDASPREGKSQWGWGVNKPLDAFGDGTITPAGTPYAITTAAAIHALLDYIEQNHLSDPQFTSEIGQIIRNVIENWINCGFQADAREREGFFQYSMSDYDAYFTVNCSMALTSAIARSISNPAVYTIPNDTHWRSCVCSSIDLAVRQMVPDLDGNPSWFYHDTDMRDKPWPNSRQDLVHHIYTLYHFEILRDLGYHVPWEQASALRSLHNFLRNGKLMTHMADSELLTNYAHLADRPARLWAAGLYLKFISIYGTSDQTDHALLMLAGYNLDSNPRSWGPDFLPEVTATALDLAHCAIGLTEFLRRHRIARASR